MTERNLAALESGEQRPWLPNAVSLSKALGLPIETLWPETFASAKAATYVFGAPSREQRGEPPDDRGHAA